MLSNQNDIITWGPLYQDAVVLRRTLGSESSVTIKPLDCILPLSYIITIDGNKCFLVELMMLYVIFFV